MTRERALELATGLLGYPPFEQGWRFSKLAANVISEMILSAVAEEREACFEIADDFDPSTFRDDPVAAVDDIARKIRERGL